MYNKSKSFKEFKQKINENNTFENDWGFYIDTDNNKLININNNHNNFCSKYSTIISISLFTIIMIIII